MSSNITIEGHAASASVASTPVAFSSVETTHAASAYAATTPASVSTTAPISAKTPGDIYPLDTASLMSIPVAEENDGLPINKKLLNAYEEIIIIITQRLIFSIITKIAPRALTSSGTLIFCQHKADPSNSHTDWH
jgi:hypothetical protein